MANRSYLYTINNDLSQLPFDRDTFNWRGVSEFKYDTPIAYRILMSVNTTTTKSALFDIDEPIGIQADYKGGVQKLFEFLDLFDEPLIADVVDGIRDEAKAFFHAPENQQQFFLLECGEIYEMCGEDFATYHQGTLEMIDDIHEDAGYLFDDIAAEIIKLDELHKPKGFLHKLFGKKPEEDEAKVKQNIRTHFEMAGFCYWSDILYFS